MINAQCLSMSNVQSISNTQISNTQMVLPHIEHLSTAKLGHCLEIENSALSIYSHH